MPHKKVAWLFYGFIVLLMIYSVLSYSATDPNLVFTSWEPYWAFQTFMWQQFFEQRLWLTAGFVVLISALFMVYFALLRALNKGGLGTASLERKHVYAYAAVVSALFVSYNALSHDVFNYMFNAKMVMVYASNPHTTVALEFANDLWVRFMHNTHTPAPYGYGWTAISLIPYILGLGKFTFTWLLFRLFAVASIVGLYLALQQISQQLRGKQLSLYQLSMLFLNPLFLIEVISNMHNDLWMMVPAMFGLSLFLKAVPESKQYIQLVLAAFVLFAFSISIKYATVVLLPVLLVIGVARKLILLMVMDRLKFVPFSNKLVPWAVQKFERVWLTTLPLVCSVLLFMPLLLPRSQLFHPWYLLWPLVWLPLINNKWWQTVLFLFSITSMFRYTPWLWTGGYEGSVVVWQQAITWIPVLSIFMVFVFFNRPRLKV